MGKITRALTTLTIPEYVSWYALDDCVVVVDLRNHRRFTLNDTAASLWRWLDHEPAMADLSHRLCTEYRVSAPIAAKDTEDFVRLLQQERLVYIFDDETRTLPR